MKQTSVSTSFFNETSSLTMSSREIASLVDSSHDNVLKTLRRLMIGGLVSETTPQNYTHPQNKQSYPEYFLNKRDSLVVVARLSPEFTARIVDRWQELEADVVRNKIVMPNFEDPAEAAVAWAEQYRQTKALSVDVDRLQKTCNTLADQFAIGMTPCQFAKQLNGVNIKKVNEQLFNSGWLFKQGSDWMVACLARDKYLKQELAELKIREGVTRICPKAVLTKKGAKAFYKLYLDDKLPMKSDWDGSKTHILFTDIE